MRAIKAGKDVTKLWMSLLLRRGTIVFDDAQVGQERFLLVVGCNKYSSRVTPITRVEVTVVGEPGAEPAQHQIFKPVGNLGKVAELRNALRHEEGRRLPLHDATAQHCRAEQHHTVPLKLHLRR